MTHIWIIMDGNRRWAESKWLPIFFWHKAWADNVKKIVEIAWIEWIEYLTLWALSKDNLVKRWSNEIEKIISLIDKIEDFLWEMMEKGLKLKTIWDIEKLPEKSVKILRWLEDKTKDNSWLILTIALVYSGQDEIIRATKKILENWLNPENLSKDDFRKYLDTSFLPNPDLIIRTWWDLRHSGFLLFDSEYSQYYFTDKKWPEFDKEEFFKALNSLKNSQRRFWK